MRVRDGGGGKESHLAEHTEGNLGLGLWGKRALGGGPGEGWLPWLPLALLSWVGLGADGLEGHEVWARRDDAGQLPAVILLDDGIAEPCDLLPGRDVWEGKASSGGGC